MITYTTVAPGPPYEARKGWPRSLHHPTRQYEHNTRPPKRVLALHRDKNKQHATSKRKANRGPRYETCRLFSTAVPISPNTPGRCTRTMDHTSVGHALAASAGSARAQVVALILVTKLACVLLPAVTRFLGRARGRANLQLVP